MLGLKLENKNKKNIQINKNKKLSINKFQLNESKLTGFCAMLQK
ncbi:MAG: hypothetical protein Q8S84_08020 [bacterium]|nr:hypothetical protein [bacterium]MDP3381384.1 hypothetical protein [bacterium]